MAMNSVLRVSALFVQENRSIHSADMSGSKFVNATPCGPVGLLPWQRAFLDRVMQPRYRPAYFVGGRGFGRTASDAVFDRWSQITAAAAAREAALEFRKHRGHGPPPGKSWRGRERNTKYLSRK